VMWQRIEIAQLLIERGANLKMKNKAGETALQIAGKGYGKNNAILDLLESAELKPVEALSEEDRKALSEGKVQPLLVVKRDPRGGCCQELSSAVFSPDARIIATKLYKSSFADNHGILFWEAATGKFIKSIEGQGEGVHSLSFQSGGKEIVTEYGKSWDVETGKLLRKEGYANPAADETTVNSTAFSADGKTVATSEKKIGERNRIIIRNALTGAEIRSFVTSSPLTHLTIAEDGKTLAGVFRDSKTVVIYDSSSGEVLQKIQINGPVFTSMVYSKDSKMLAVSAGTMEAVPITVFDTATGKELYRLQNEWAHSIIFSPDGKLLVAASGDDSVKIWEAASGRLLRALEGHKELVRSVRFSPYGDLLVSGGGDNEAKIWSVKSGKLLVTLKAFNDGNWLAYTPDGFYNGSQGASKYINWQVNKKMFSAAVFKAQYFKPEIIASRMRD
jgi:WD40 repeat protein